MSRVTEYTCEGCRARSTNSGDWSFEYFDGKYQDFCAKCTKRLKALMSNPDALPASGVPEDEVQARVEAATAPLRKQIEALEADRRRQISVLEDANSALQRRVADLDQFGADMSKAAERIEADRARAVDALATEKGVSKGLSERVAQLEVDLQNERVDLSDARDENEHDAEVHRKVVWELLGMLGKKARRRNARRIDEIAIANSGDDVWARDTEGRDWSQYYSVDDRECES